MSDEDSSVKWAPVAGWDGVFLDRFEASTTGVVRSLARRVDTGRGYTRVVPPKEVAVVPKGTYGHLAVCMWDGRQTRQVQLGAVVLSAHVGPRPKGHLACHRNGDPLDNRLSNLYWGTPKQNSDDARRHGTHGSSQKTHCTNGHLLSGNNIRRSVKQASGKRSCRTCANARGLVYYARSCGRELSFEEAAAKCYARIMSGGPEPRRLRLAGRTASA